MVALLELAMAISRESSLLHGAVCWKHPSASRQLGGVHESMTFWALFTTSGTSWQFLQRQEWQEAQHPGRQLWEAGDSVSGNGLRRSSNAVMQ